MRKTVPVPVLSSSTAPGAKAIDGKALDGVLNIGWHTDQLHRMGAGREPDLKRGRLATTIALLRRNGTVSFRPKRRAR